LSTDESAGTTVAVGNGDLAAKETTVGAAGDVAAERAGRMSHLDVVDYVLANPYSLPRNTRIILEEKAREIAEQQHNSIQKRQSGVAAALLGALANSLISIGKDPPRATVAAVQDTPSPLHPEATRRKIRYGPYRIPRTSENNVESRMLQQQGMTNTLSIGAKKPCGKDCMILDINANLEYADGKAVPSTPDGAWLHHLVLINAGFNVRDATCGGILENVFESGNERTDSPYFTKESGVKSGYHVRNEDIFIINSELMNMEDKEKWAWVTIEYDMIEGFRPDWKDGKIVWMSIGPDRCTGSELNPFGSSNLTKTQQPIRNTFFEYSVPWTSPADGLILGNNCHLHDGGTSTRFYLEGKMICESIPRYSNGSGLPTMGMSPMRKRQMGTHKNSEIPHIEDQPPCVYKEAIPIKRGQDMYIKADYDFTIHEGMKNKKGELDEVMAIAGALIAFNYPI